MLLLSLLLIIGFQLIQSRCPNWCNQRGHCTSPTESGVCLCDMGYTSDDCSELVCPAAFDPVQLRKYTGRRKVRLETGNHGGANTGQLEFFFGGSSIFLDADASSLTSEKCTSSLNHLESVTGITCVRDSYNEISKTGNYIITLENFPLVPYFNNVIYHNGNPSLDLFSCNTSSINTDYAIDPFCYFHEVEVLEPIPIYAECANHGECNRFNGKCICEKGFHGIGCHDITDNKDIELIEHDGPFFTASLLHVNAKRGSSNEFNYLQISQFNENITTIQGDRLLVHHGSARFPQGNIILAPSSQDIIPSKIHTYLTSDNTNDASSFHLYAQTNDKKVFSVSQGGDIQLSGGIYSSEGIFSLSSDGHLQTKQLTINENSLISGDLQVNQKLKLGETISLSPKGLSFDIQETLPNQQSIFQLHSSDKQFKGTLLELQTQGDDNTLIRTISNGQINFELTSSGRLNTNGLRLKTGGVQVDSGGINIAAGGLKVAGGIELISGDLKLDTQVITVAGMKISENTDAPTLPLLDLKKMSKHSVGNVIELTIPSDSVKHEDNAFLSLYETSNEEKKKLFSIDAQGLIQSQSGAKFNGKEGLEVKGTSHLHGSFSLFPRKIVPIQKEGSNEFIINIPSNVNYLIIEALKTHPETHIELVFDSNESIAPGRIVLITNQHSSRTTGVLAIPSQSTILVIYDGKQWKDLEALNAPMSVLKDVTSFHASKDLDIGNVSFSAETLKSTRLTKGSIVFIGNDGSLSEHANRLTYLKGVLTSPSLYIDRLVSSVDARGNEISNVLIRNTKVLQASVTATDITMPQLSDGIAYFNSKGQLSSSKGFRLNEDEQLLIDSFHQDINGNGYIIDNITLSHGHLSDIVSASIHSLSLPSLLNPSSSNNIDPLIIFDSKSSQLYSSGSLNVGISKENKNEFHVKGLALEFLSKDFDGQNHQIHNIVLTNSRLINSSIVSTNDLIVNSLQSSTKTPKNPSDPEALRFVFTDEQGKLHATSSPWSRLHFHHIAVDNLEITSEAFSLQGKELKDTSFDASNILIRNSFPSLSTKSLKLTPEKPLLTKGISLLGHDATSNEIISLETIAIENSILRSTLPVESTSLITNEITIKNIPEGRPVGVDHNQRLSALDSLTIPSLNIQQDLLVNRGSKFVLVGKSSVVLGTNTAGEIIPLVGNMDNLPNIQLSIKDIKTQRIEVKESIKVNSLDVDEAFSFSSELQERKYLQEEISSDYLSLVHATSKGRIDTSLRVLLHRGEGSLHVGQLHPLPQSNRFTIMNADLQHPILHDATIETSSSISTELLKVSGYAEIAGEASVGARLTVQGQVFASGPYVDTSDSRFKTNVKPITNSLDKIMQLQAVEYQYKVNEYPGMNFPTSNQIGWIAQDVRTIIPELVEENHLPSNAFLNHTSTNAKDDTYLSLAYSHSCVLVAEAVKELKLQHDQELDKLQQKHQEDILAMKQELYELKTLLQQIIANK